MTFIRKNLSYILLTFCLLLFSVRFFCGGQKNATIRYDEVYCMKFALQLLNNNMPENDMLSRNIMGKSVILASTPRHGALEQYLLVPFMAIRDLKPGMARLSPFPFAILTMVLVFIAGKTLFNETIAVISTFFMAVNESFLSEMILGVVWGFTLPVFALLATILAYKYFDTDKKRYMYFCMFVLGIGMNSKGFFIWFVAAFFVSLFFCYGKHILARKRVFLTGGLFFLTGASPVLYYYLTSQPFHEFVGRSLITTDIMQEGTRFSANNLSFLQNLTDRIRHVGRVISIHILSDGKFVLPVYLVFSAGVITLAYKRVFKRSFHVNRRGISLLISIIVCTVVLSCYTFTVFRPGHLLVLTSFIQIIAAVTLYELYKSSNIKVMRLVVVLAFLTYACLGSAREVNESTDAKHFIELVGWLKSNNIEEVLVTLEVDRKLRRGIMLYSNSDIKIRRSGNTLGMLNKKCIDHLKSGRQGAAIMMKKDDRGYDNFDKILKSLDKQLVAKKNIYGCVIYFVEEKETPGDEDIRSNTAS